jgi:hypothetical protein
MYSIPANSGMSRKRDGVENSLDIPIPCALIVREFPSDGKCEGLKRITNLGWICDGASGYEGEAQGNQRGSRGNSG